MSIALVTDSTADIPPHDLNRFPIYSVPAILVLNGTPFRDGEQITREDFYRRLPRVRPLPTTAAPSVGDFQNLFERLLSQEYSEILAIHAASSLSGIYNASRLAAEAFPGQVHVLDSRQLSTGLGFQVLEAARRAEQGLPIPRIIDHIDKIREKIHVHALLNTFEYIHRSGRVSWVKAQLGALLNVKPLIELKDGEVIAHGLSRSRRKGIDNLLSRLRGLEDIQTLAVLHTDPVFEDREGFLEKAGQLIKGSPHLIHVTTVIGTHVGPHGLGFAAMVK